jgi:hypothetical protein
MNRLVCTLAVVAAALVVAIPAGASQRSAVTLALNGTLNGPNTVAGTWVATGGIEDAGTYTETFEIVESKIAVVKVFAGSKGTFVLEGRGTIHWPTPCTATFTGGRWRIADGTGAYAQLHADGRPVTTPESFGDVCTGVIRITHVGTVRKGGETD